MDKLPFEARTANGHRGTMRCHWCADTGYVVVNQRPVQPCVNRGTIVYPADETDRIDEMAPCPYCRVGYREEFPEPAAGRQAFSITPPWGEHGYWHDKPTAEIAAMGSVSALPLPNHENAKRMRELAGRLPSMLKSMPND